MDIDGWTYDDFLRRLEAVRNFGSLDDLAEQIPGMDAVLSEMDTDLEEQVEPILRILRAMSHEERTQPKLLDGEEGPARREAIAERAGVPISAVDSLIWQFQRLREMLAERTLEDVTRELVEEAAPQREPWQEAASAWKKPQPEEEKSEDAELSEAEGLDDFDEEAELAKLEAESEDAELEAFFAAKELTGARLDELLRKISSSGIDSLTGGERDELERASALLRARG